MNLPGILLIPDRFMDYRMWSDIPDRLLGRAEVLGPGSVELFVDPLLFRCLTQLLVLRNGHHHRYHRAPMMDNVVGVTGGQFTHEGHGNDMDRQPGAATRQAGRVTTQNDPYGLT